MLTKKPDWNLHKLLIQVGESLTFVAFDILESPYFGLENTGHLTQFSVKNIPILPISIIDFLDKFLKSDQERQEQEQDHQTSTNLKRHPLTGGA